MKDSPAERYPSQLPFSARVFLQLRKVYRQTMARLSESAAAKKPPDPLLADGASTNRPRDASVVTNPGDAINKSGWWFEQDLNRPAVRAVADRIEALKMELKQRGLRYTNTAGNFLPREYNPQHERGKLWENAWVIAHAGVKSGQRVLDVGGASTIFSFYLASLGCEVVVVDNDWANCGTLHNANAVARQMNWKLEALDRDIQHALPFADGHFDRVFSVCVLEHLPPALRQYVMRQMSRVLKAGGIAGFTTDYDAAREVLITDRGLRFAYMDKFRRDVLEPSGLSVYGAADWTDPYPEDAFLGAFFLHKPAA